MIGDTNREVPVNETFHVQTDDELTEKELKQIEADDQAIQTILLGLPEDIYAAEKNAKLFNEWERFTSNEGESIESYYNRFLKLMNDLKRNKQFLENLKFLNNLQLEWSQHVTIMVGGNGENQFRQYARQNVRNLNGYNAIQNVEKQVAQNPRFQNVRNQNGLIGVPRNQASTSGTQTDKAPVYDSDGSDEVHDYENSDDNEIFNMFTQEEQYTKLIEPIPEPHQNYMQQPMPNLEDITDPMTAINMALALMAIAFKLKYSTPTNNNQRISSNPHNRQIAQLGMNMGQDRQMQMVGGNGENQFRQYARQNVRNL
nr:hypothetical protein [Tanacetum cinerariifolium]